MKNIHIAKITITNHTFLYGWCKKVKAVSKIEFDIDLFIKRNSCKSRLYKKSIIVYDLKFITITY